MGIARILLLFTVIVWGWTFVATKICLAYMSPLELLGMRLIIAEPILLLLILTKKIRLQFNGKAKWLLLASGIMLVHFLIQITGIKYTSATNTGWIISMTPLITAVLAFLILKEQISRNALLGIVLATAGILFLVSKGKFGDMRWLSSIGDWLVLASAHTWALYTITTRDISRSANPIVVAFAVLLPVLIVVFGIMIFTSNWAKFLSLPIDAVISLLFMGICATALAYWFWQLGISKVGATEAGIFLYIEPIATTALAVPYLHESFGVFTALGGLLVLLGVWVAQRR